MLTTKSIKIHGMKDERWTIRDKLVQYRGILKLHSRNKKLQITNAAKLRKKVSRDLESLKEDVRKYREIVGDVIFGDGRLLRNVLQQHREFQLALQNSQPGEACDAVFQDLHCKQKQLDKIQYERERKMKAFRELKLESSMLEGKIKEEQEFQEDYEQQNLVTRHQQSMAKENAAKAINVTYQAMLDILKKDSIYFDAVLSALQGDQKEQGKIMFKAIVMGQLATENVDDIRQNYKKMARDVWVNMKERERTLEIVRAQVKDLWAYAQSLVRVESDTDFTPKKKPIKYTNESLERQISLLEEIFEKVKESLLVRSFEELFSRLEGQIEQKERLAEQFNRNRNERDDLLNKTRHAEMILASINHSVLSTSGQYKTEKKEMLEEIEVQKKREMELKKLIKSHGELHLEIRAALQSVLAMLVCVKAGKVGKAGKKTKDARRMTPNNRKTEDTVLQVESIETDSLALLSQVSRKVGVLSAMSNFEMEEEVEERAKESYQSYVMDFMSKLAFKEAEPEPTGIFVEHEIVDANVPTRLDIKLRSRKLVKSHTRQD